MVGGAAVVVAANETSRDAARRDEQMFSLLLLARRQQQTTAMDVGNIALRGMAEPWPAESNRYRALPPKLQPCNRVEAAGYV